jgi:hypothetical protein
MHQALAHLLGPYRLLAARQLFHNRHEVTALLAPKGERPGSDRDTATRESVSRRRN